MFKTLRCKMFYIIFFKNLLFFKNLMLKKKKRGNATVKTEIKNNVFVIFQLRSITSISWFTGQIGTKQLSRPTQLMSHKQLN